MDGADQSWVLITAALALGLMTLMGFGILFSKATNIERPLFVGSATLAGCLLAMLILRLVWVEGGPYNWWQGAVVIGLPIVAFGLARLTDRLMGSRAIEPEKDEATYGAHLSD